MSEDRPAARLADPSLWVDHHGDYLFRYALLRLGDRTMAEDLVQETLLAALRSGRRFAGRSAERTWFVGILKHKIVDQVRKKAREMPASAADSAGGDIEQLFDQRGRWRVKLPKWGRRVDESLETREFWTVFRRCLAKLPQRLAAVFSLREIDELSSDQVCSALQITTTNLGVLLYRARLQLRSCLEIHWFHTRKEGV
jgi:RNA polymerase sigma-70 factor (ECF subfamily)